MNPIESMRLSLLTLAWACALACGLACPTAAYAVEPVVEMKGPAQRPARSWFGLNTGLVSGSVELPCSGGASGDCDESGLFQTYGVNLTVAGRTALRLRAMRAEEKTDHKPYETAVLFGPRLGRSHWYGLVGVGRIMHPDDDYAGDVTGLAWEFVRARPTRDGLGFEFSIHGNSFGDASFVGVAVGLRLGKLR